MEDTTARTIVREFAAVRPTSAGRETAWKWAAGVIHFPESYCPWCGAAMLSTAIWLTRETPPKLLGQVKLDGSRLVKLSPSHPHINAYNSVCMRDDRSDGTNSVYQALFLAYNFDSMYWSVTDPRKYLTKPRGDDGGYYNVAQQWRNWLSNYFGHTCSSATVTARGLSAELQRAKVKAAAVELAANEVAARPAEVQPPTLDELPIFGTAANPRTRRRTAERGLFDGSISAGITAD